MLCSASGKILESTLRPGKREAFAKASCSRHAKRFPKASVSKERQDDVRNVILPHAIDRQETRKPFGSDRCEAVLVLEQFEHKPDRGPECQEGSGGEGATARERRAALACAWPSPNREICPRIFEDPQHRFQNVMAPGHGSASRASSQPKPRHAVLCASSNPAGKFRPDFERAQGPLAVLGYRVISVGL